MHTIRFAEPRDHADIVRLIRALATFENLSGPNDDAAARIAEHAFGPRPMFEVLIAEQGGNVVGFALFFMTYSTFLARPSVYLEDLFVDPPARRSGIGKDLLSKLASIALERGAGRFEWSVLDWNESAQAFYRSIGASILPDWRICRIADRRVLEELALGTR